MTTLIGRSSLARLAIAGSVWALTQVSAHAADPTGTWTVADGTAQIKIEPCGSAGYFGSIVWEKQPGVDANNPDPNRRGKPMLGVAILQGMKPAESAPEEWQGRVYNPKDGGFYFARLSMRRDDALRLEGCILGGLLCDGETWTRAQPTTVGAAPSRGRSACPVPARHAS